MGEEAGEGPTEISDKEGLFCMGISGEDISASQFASCKCEIVDNNTMFNWLIIQPHYIINIANVAS